MFGNFQMFFFHCEQLILLDTLDKDLLLVRFLVHNYQLGEIFTEFNVSLLSFEVLNAILQGIVVLIAVNFIA